MRRAGLSFDGLVVDGDFNLRSGVEGAAELLDQGVDAIFCANDATAAGALETIRARGLQVPDQVALAGFDDLEFAAHLDPPDHRAQESASRDRAPGVLQLSGAGPRPDA